MKTLLVLRHAKSSWETDDRDHDRPLNKRGLRDAPHGGALLRETKILPDLILTSTAARAQATTDLVVEASGYSGAVEKSRALYHADPEGILEVVRALDDALERVMIVGHNPGLEEFIEALEGEFHRLPTAAMAHITLPIDHWGDASLDGSARVVRVHRPKEL